MKLVTCNIRCNWSDDGINSFIHRSGDVLLEIDRQLPDVICFQEMTDSHAEFFMRHLPEYETVFRGRNKEMRGEGLAVSVRRATAELYETDVEWFSETPKVPDSRYPESNDDARILMASTVRMKTGQVFRVYNVHLEYCGDTVRYRQAVQTLGRIEADRRAFALPCFLLGDFNATRDNEAYKHIAASELVDLTPSIPQTFHNYGMRTEDLQIDYIFADPETARRPHAVKLWDTCADGIYLSDHYPIELEAEL